MSGDVRSPGLTMSVTGAAPLDASDVVNVCSSAGDYVSRRGLGPSTSSTMHVAPGGRAATVCWAMHVAPGGSAATVCMMLGGVLSPVRPCGHRMLGGARCPGRPCGHRAHVGGRWALPREAVSVTGAAPLNDAGRAMCAAPGRHCRSPGRHCRSPSVRLLVCSSPCGAVHLGRSGGLRGEPSRRPVSWAPPLWWGGGRGTAVRRGFWRGARLNIGDDVGPPCKV